MASGTDQVLTRPFVADRSTFMVRCPSTTIKNCVEELFLDLPEADPGGVVSEIVFEASSDGGFAARVGDRDSVPQQLSIALMGLTSAVTRLSLDADADRLHLHCAALVLQSRGVLISAASGTGKTVLAGALALRGWTYLTDESIALNQEPLSVSAFPKPLMLKSGGGDLLPQLADARLSLALDDEERWHVPVSRVPAHIAFRADPKLIVILHRATSGLTDAPPIVTPLHPTDAVVALMDQSLDAERFGPDALIVLGDLAARCRCVALTVGPLDAMCSTIEDLAEGASEYGEDVRQLEPAPDADALGWNVANDVRSVKIGDRMVVHNTKTGSIAALDEGGAGIWDALCGELPGWLPPEAMSDPATVSFLQGLASLELIARTPAHEVGGA